MALTDIQIRNAVPREKPYKLSDGGSLFLLVTTGGSKLWRWKYRYAATEKLLSFGPYPLFSLKDARRLRDEAKRILAAGADPALVKKEAKRVALLEASNSLLTVAQDFIAVRLEGSGKADSTIAKAQFFLEQLKPLHRRPVSNISAVDVLAVLKKIEAAGKRETARRTRDFASRVFRHGVATGRCQQDPAALLSGALSPPKVKHRSAIIDPMKLGRFLQVVSQRQAEGVTKIAMQLLPHVFLRPGELRLGKWLEIDWEESIWKIPGERTKLRRPHSVPLSRQALELLNQLREESGGVELMFPGVRSMRRPISENTLNQAYRRLGYGPEVVTAHGFRATASTLLNESGLWHPDAIERALAHGHSNQVRGVYARGQFWDERVRMAQWWSDYLEELQLNAGQG